MNLASPVCEDVFTPLLDVVRHVGEDVRCVETVLRCRQLHLLQLQLQFCQLLVHLVVATIVLGTLRTDIVVPRLDQRPGVFNLRSKAVLHRIQHRSTLTNVAALLLERVAHEPARREGGAWGGKR